MEAAQTALNWLRDVAHAVARAGRLDEWMQAHTLLDIIEDDPDAVVPGFNADYHQVDWDMLLSQDFVEYQEEDEFRAGMVKERVQELIRWTSCWSTPRVTRWPR